MATMDPNAYLHSLNIKPAHTRSIHPSTNATLQRNTHNKLPALHQTVKHMDCRAAQCPLARARPRDCETLADRYRLEKVYLSEALATGGRDRRCDPGVRFQPLREEEIQIRYRNQRNQRNLQSKKLIKTASGATQKLTRR